MWLLFVISIQRDPYSRFPFQNSSLCLFPMLIFFSMIEILGSMLIFIYLFLGQKTVYYPHVSWFSTFSTSSFFRPKVIPKVLILGQFHTSVSQTVKSDDVAYMWTMTGRHVSEKY